MKNISYVAHVLCAFFLLTTFFSGHAWDWSGPKKFYYGLWLIHPIRQKAEAKSADWCREGVKVAELAQIKVLENYEAPRWINWLGAIPVKESMFDYAYDIYKKIQFEMDTLMQLIDTTIKKQQLTQASQDALNEQQAAWRELDHEGLDHVLNEGAAKFEPTDEYILKNLKAALKILDNLISVLPKLTFAQPMPITSVSTPKSTIRTQDTPAYQVVDAQKQKSAAEVAQFQEGQRQLDITTEKLKKKRK